jgi:hypothetical protein
MPNLNDRLRQIYAPAASGARENRKDYRIRAAELEAADKASRSAAMMRLSSAALEPGDRIRLWEEIYRVRLPHSADHPLVPVVAKHTALSIEQIVAEQRRRVARAR